MNLTLPLRGFSVTINYNRNYNYKIIKITMISITMIKNTMIKIWGVRGCGGGGVALI